MACLDGQGGFNWEGLAALKTHVTLREALEIEAIKCVAGDARHEFQGFYSTWLAEQKQQGSDLSQLGQLDPARLLEEIEMTRQAIDEHETMLAEHRGAIVSKVDSPYSDEHVEQMYATAEALRSTLPMLEAEYTNLMKQREQRGQG